MCCFKVILFLVIELSTVLELLLRYLTFFKKKNVYSLSMLITLNLLNTETMITQFMLVDTETINFNLLNKNLVSIFEYLYIKLLLSITLHCIKEFC